MNYELAKSLKDAGFPQTGKGPTIIADNYPKERNTAVEPTLSELIEACGDDFGSLDRNDDGTWRAYATKGERREELNTYCEAGCCGYVEEKTPEEAISNLWLLLNKK